MTSPAGQATGASAWALGLLVLLPIPMLGSLAAGGAMIAAYDSLSRQGPVARANAAAAKRWGAVFLVVSTALLVIQLVFGLLRLGGQWPAEPGMFPVAVPLLLYIAVCLAHLVVVIVTLPRVRRGEVVRMLGSAE